MNPICEKHKLPLEKDPRHSRMEVWRCPDKSHPYIIQVPPGYFRVGRGHGKVVYAKVCELPSCDAPLTRPNSSRMGRPRKFCCRDHQMKAYNSRKRLERMSEVSD